MDSDPASPGLASGIIGLLLLALYFLPALVAKLRAHHQRGAILALNILLGWTLLGWVIAFVWAVTAVRAAPSVPQPEPAPSQPKAKLAREPERAPPPPWWKER